MNFARVSSAAALNVAGQIVPVVVGVLAIPAALRSLGAPRFGDIAIAIAALSYVTLLEMPLGRATVRRCAEAIGQGNHRAAIEVWSTSLIAQVGLGVLVGGALATASMVGLPAILPPTFTEVGRALPALGLCIPATYLMLSGRALLEARRRFGLLNAIGAPATSFTYLVPVLAGVYGWSVSDLLLWLAAGRVVAGAMYAAAGLGNLAYLTMLRPNLHDLRLLITFARPVLISSFAEPLLFLSDRFVVAAVLGVSAVAYYSAISDAVSRLWVVPAAYLWVLMPTFSVMNQSDRDGMRRIYVAALDRISALMLAAAGATIILARDIPMIWLGPDAAGTGAPLRILALAMWSNALAYAPVALLYGRGRPGLVARLHLIEVLVYLPALVLLTHAFGLAGAAAATSLRMASHAGALIVTVDRVYADLRRGHGHLFVALIVLIGLVPIAVLTDNLPGEAQLWVKLLLLSAVLSIALGLGSASIWGRVTQAARSMPR